MKRKLANAQRTTSAVWSTEQDIYLIEYSHCSMAELSQHLPYSEEQILQRKVILGLSTREKQLRRLIFRN